VTGSDAGSRLPAPGFRKALAILIAVVTMGGAAVSGEEAVLSLRATVVSAGAPLTITLFRWSTDAERAPVIAALSAPPPPPVAAAAAPGRAGRAGRAGGRGAPPPSPAERVSASIKAAPTLGYIWGNGVTGYSIKYAWRSEPAAQASDRIVLITERKLGAHAPEWTLPRGPAPDAEFTVIELRLDARGAGEGKTSSSANVVLDAAAKTLALDGYAAAPVLLKVSR
jgi:hypothetical protein